MRTIDRSLIIVLCLIIAMTTLGAATATADELPSSKSVSVTVTLSGIHSASDFPATYSYDDGLYTGTLNRKNNTLKNVVRSTPTVTYTAKSSKKYPNDKSASKQCSFSSKVTKSYYDPESGQSFSAKLSKSGKPYFAGTATTTTLYWTHYGYEYDPVNHSKLGYMSTNSSTYYSGRYRFSSSPRQPTDYYGPPAEAGLGWVQYKAPDWDGGLQDAQQEPWRSICLARHGTMRFQADNGSLNRYRKPVRIYYRRITSSQYIYQKYSGKATVKDTQITYTGTVTRSASGADIEIVDSTITDWYEGLDVTVSATVRNLTDQPVPDTVVQLTIGDKSYTENIPVPAEGSNLAVFRITVPPVGDYVVQVTADPGGELNDMDVSNNTLTRNIHVKSIPPSIVADPDDRAMEQYYEVHGITGVPTLSSSDYHTWQEVRLENGIYETKTYYARLETTFSTWPDERIAYADKPKQMESGFGFSVRCFTNLTTDYDHPEKLVGPQLVWVRCPESAYGQIAEWQDVRDSLKVETGNPGGSAVTWQLGVNPWSVTGQRLHYVPLWFPDGQYIAFVQALYAWSPNGQLYKYETDSLIIEGDMYDRVTTIQR